MTADSGELVREDEGGIARLWLKRPAKRNAISEDLYNELLGHLRELGSDGHVRIVVFGSGVPGVFCAGADIETMADPRPAELERQFDLLLACIDAFRACSKPILTAVRGDCLGVGCALAAASDIAVASANARFALPEIRLGLAPVLAMASLAPVMTRRQLVYWSATGRHFSAEEACQAGLVTSVVADDAFAAFVTQLANDLGQADGTALTHVKSTAGKLYPLVSGEARDALMRDMIATATSPAARAAIDGFLQRKRRA